MICVYEDEGLARLSPLADLRPVFDLRVGRFTLLEKLRRWYPKEEFLLWVRDELAGLVAEAHPDYRVNRPLRKREARMQKSQLRDSALDTRYSTFDILFISGRAILEKRIEPAGPEAVMLAGDEVVGFRICAEHAEKLRSLEELSASMAPEPVEARVVKRPWDAVEFNAAELEKECRIRGQKSQSRMQNAELKALPKGVAFVGPRADLSISRGARVWPETVISTETGPVTIESGVEMRPGSFIEGPCYVGPNTVVDGAKVRPGCSFGPHCRIGGEIESSIFQGFSNKHHDGFIGHSFVGEWVNLGALTTNSDLKNAYQPAQVFFRGKPVETGLLKVGCFIGDHAKTAIGTLLNTGTRVGTFANWFEPGLSPREIAPFARGRRGRWNLPDAVACAREVMRRRGVQMSANYEQNLKRLYASDVTRST